MKKLNIINARISVGVPYIPDDGTIPTVRIDIYTDGEDGKQYLRTGYLTPFRRYCFQISGNEKGGCDMGASPALTDMKPILGLMDKKAGKSFLNGQAALAVQAFIPSYSFGRKVFVENFSYKYLPKDYLSIIQDENIKNWCNFIDQSYEWIKG